MKDNKQYIAKMMENNIVQQILLPKNYVKLHRSLVVYLGLEHAAFASVIIEFDSHLAESDSQIVRDGKNWIYISVEDALKRYRLTADKFQKLSNDLSDTGLFETKIFGLPKRKHFHVNYKKLLEILTLNSEKIEPFLYRKNTDKVIGAKPTIISEESRQPLYIDVSNKEKNKDNISSHSSDNNKVLEEKQTQDVVVSESLINNIDANCTLPSQDSTKESLSQEKNYKYLQNKERFDFIREKTKYWNDNSPESARIKSGKKGEKGNDWCLKKLYDMVGKEKAEVVFEAVMSMPNRKAHYLVSKSILEQTLATYQDPNQETPKYLSNEAYKRQSHYKGGNVPDEKMIPSEATFYAALEWHFSDRYEGTELVKKVREFIQENNCKFKNY